MHATLWVDVRRRGWLALYADGARTWQAAVGSMPLAADHEIPDGMPLSARVDVRGPALVGAQPVVEYEGMRFTTTGALREVREAPAYGVEPVSAVTGRYAPKPGRAHPGGSARQRDGRFPVRWYGLWTAWVVFSVAINPILAGFGAGPLVVVAASVAVAAPVFAVSFWRYRQIRESSRRASESQQQTTLRAVVWHSLSTTGEELLQPMLSLYPLDAGDGAAPIVTIPLIDEPDPPVPYADEVVVHGDVRPGGDVIIEHADRRLLPASKSRTDFAPARRYHAPTTTGPSR